MADDEYEIISHKEILDLKRQIDNLRGNSKDQVSTKSLKTSIDSLNKNLTLMIELFSEANKMMKTEEKEAGMVQESVGPLLKKIDTLLDQNQTVAKGIITIADMVKKNLSDVEKPVKEEPNKLPESMSDQQHPSPFQQPQPLQQTPPIQPTAQQSPETNINLKIQSAPSKQPPSFQTNVPNSSPSIGLPPADNQMHSTADLSMTSNIPPLPQGQPGSLGPNIEQPPGKSNKRKPLFSLK